MTNSGKHCRKRKLEADTNKRYIFWTTGQNAITELKKLSRIENQAN